VSIRFHVDPGDVPPVTAARRLGLSLEAFTAKLPELVARADDGAVNRLLKRDPTEPAPVPRRARSHWPQGRKIAKRADPWGKNRRRP
jgi:hypothetical protein